MNLYSVPNHILERYPDTYFSKRQGNDPLRQRQFSLEKQMIEKYVKGGAVLDVGCSTGEFLSAIEWQGEKYGMEISDFARAQAKESGIRFDRDLLNTVDFFDLVVFRGTIQHVDEPFRFIKLAYKSLKPGGFVVFLATPNVNSPLYRAKKTLPALNPRLNFYVPDDINFPNALRNFGFEVREMRYPYLGTPYCRLFRDHFYFFLNLISKKFYPHAFWRSMIEVVAQKT